MKFTPVTGIRGTIAIALMLFAYALIGHDLNAIFNPAIGLAVAVVLGLFVWFFVWAFTHEQTGWIQFSVIIAIIITVLCCLVFPHSFGWWYHRFTGWRSIVADLMVLAAFATIWVKPDN